jgi:hypothetical protein
LLLVPISTNTKFEVCTWIKESNFTWLQFKFITLFMKASQLHIVLNMFFRELLNNLPPFLPLGVFISQGLVLHFE